MKTGERITQSLGLFAAGLGCGWFIGSQSGQLGLILGLLLLCSGVLLDVRNIGKAWTDKACLPAAAVVFLGVFGPGLVDLVLEKGLAGCTPAALFRVLAPALLGALVFAPLFVRSFTLWRARAQQKAAESGRPAFPALLFFAAMALPPLLYWKSALPEYYSNDLAYQQSMLAGEFPLNDVHTFAHTALLWLCGGKAWVLILVQLAAMALLLTLFAGWFYKKGAGIFSLTALFSLLCVPGSYLWMFGPSKDLPAAVAAGFTLYYICRLLAGDLPLKWPHILGFGAAIAFTGLFRHNGLVTVVLVVLWLVCRAFYRRSPKLLAVCGAAAVLVLGVNVGLCRLVGVQSVQNGFSVQVYTTGIIAVDRAGGNITQEQRERMQQLLPMDYVNYCLSEGHYDWYPMAVRLCWANDLYTYQAGPNEQQFAHLVPTEAGMERVYNNLLIRAAGENPGEIIKLYLELFFQNPAICIRELLHNTTTIWKMNGELFDHILYLTLIFAVFACLGRGMLRYWPVLLPILCNVASIVVAACTNELRYLLPTFLLAVPAALFLALCRNTSKESEESSVCL